MCDSIVYNVLSLGKEVVNKIVAWNIPTAVSNGIYESETEIRSIRSFTLLTRNDNAALSSVRNASKFSDLHPAHKAANNAEMWILAGVTRRSTKERKRPRQIMMMPATQL